MSALGNLFLSCINKIGRNIPKGIQRRIADFPGVLTLFEKLSRDQSRLIKTPEGFTLAINPLFHANLVASGDLNGYEPDLRRAISDLARPGMVAYDVGANVGVHSFLFAARVRPGGMVYAFEPERNNFVCLEESLALNDGHAITLCKKALGRAPGVEKFDRRGGAFSGRLVGQTEGYVPTDNIALVETTSVDTLVQSEGFRPPDIVKIDVEGNELLVLEGMRGVLQARHPIILCEVHTHLGDVGDRVLQLLSDCGYAITALDGTLIDRGGSAVATATAKPQHIVAMRK